MKPGLVASASLHALLLGWGLVSFTAPDPFEVSEPASLPVDLVSVEEFSQAVAGDASAPLAETPAPTPTQKPETLPMPAENVGENEVDLETPPTPQARPEEVRQASAEAAPPPTPEPPTPEPEPAPQPEPQPAPPEPVAEPAPQPPPHEPQPQPEPPPQEVAAVPEAEPELPAIVPVPVSRPRPPEPPPEPVKVAEAKPKPEPVEEKPKPQPEKPKPETPKAEAPNPEKPEKPVETAKPKPEKPAETAKPAQAQKPREEATRTAERESRGETESDFNADEIAALLDRSKASGGGAKRSQAPAAAGAFRTTGAKLTRGEMDALSQQLGGCWSMPPGVEEAASLTVVLRFSVDATGRLNGAPQITETSGNRAFDQSAKRAVQKCDRQEGLKLPMDKVEQFADYVEVGFNPSAMF